MPEKHEHHHWLIAILAIAVIVLIGLVAFFAYQLFYGDAVRTVKRIEFDESQLDEALNEQRQIIEKDLEQEAREEGEALEIDEDPTAIYSYSGTSIAPGFSYPADWHVFVSGTFSEQPGVLNTVFIGPQPIQILAGTDASPAPIHGSVINLTEFDLQSHATYADYLVDSLTNEFVVDLQVSSRQEANGILTTVTGRQEGGLGADHNFEYIVFETSNHAVSISFRDTIAESDDDTAWNQIKSSLDFSTIQ